MIPKEIIEARSSYWHSFNSDLGDGFDDGVEFAENYLKDLSIEFAMWLADNKWYRTQNSLNEKFWVRHIFHGDWNDRNKNTDELFEIFIKEKYGEAK